MSGVVISHQAGTPQITSTELLTLSFARTNRARIGSGVTSTSLPSNSRRHHLPHHTPRKLAKRQWQLSHGFDFSCHLSIRSSEP
jgi:hypothetical protein